MPQKVNKKVQYPDNLKVKAALRHGDGQILAARSRYSQKTILQILSGVRRMPDSLAKEIVKLINERKAIEAELKQALTQKS